MLLMFLQCSKTFATSQDTLPAFLGVWYIPKMNWNMFYIQHKSIDKPLDLKFNTSGMTSIEGNFGIRQIGIRLGFTAQMDNNTIGKAYRWGGYLGIKNMWLKIQRSTMDGILTWNGTLPEGNYYSTMGFSNKYFNIDILKTFTKKTYVDGKRVVNPVDNQMGFYWGVGYTSFGFPVEIATLTTEGDPANDMKFGTPAYDSLYKIQSFNICGGFDLLRQLCHTGARYGLTPGMKPMKLAVYASTEDKMGFGSGKLTNYSIDMAEALNPGRSVRSNKFFNVNVHYFLSLGLRTYWKLGTSLMIIAAGYDFEGTAFFPFGNSAKNKDDLGLDFLGTFLNHGFSVKLYIAWDRDWKDVK